MGGGSETMIVEKNLQFAEAYQHHRYKELLQNVTKMVRYRVRRLTPLECERLDGFPDNWTEYGASGKEMSDKTRYEALGNSIAVPCADRVFAGIIAAEKNGGQDNE